MKKILHISQTDINFDSRILKELTALLNGGYDVFGFGVCSNGGKKKYITGLSGRITCFNLKSKIINYIPKFFNHFITLLGLIITIVPRAIKLKPDVIHCHDTLALPVGVVISFFTKAKVIYDAHELESDRNGLSPLLGWLTLKAEKILWPFVDALIVVSPSIEKWYCDNVGPKKSTVIFNSPIIESIKIPADDYLRNKYSISTGVPIFVYVGILGAGRGIDLILSAFTNDKVKSHVVFLGYGDLVNDLKIISSKFNNIHLHDPVPHAEVVPVIRSADYGLCLIQKVSLSDYYCLPNKLFEYCFAGIPVLASDFPDIRKVVNEFNLGEICELSEKAVLNSIQRLEVNLKSWNFKDLQPLSWQSQETKLLSLYGSLIKTKQQE